MTALGGSNTQVRTGRLVLMLIAGALVLLCAGGAGVALVAYRDATEPDRSSPDVAVDNYLRAFLVDRNDTRAQLYACRTSAQLTVMDALRRDIEAREAEHSIKIMVSWGSLTVDERAGRSDVTVEVRRAIADGSESDRQTYRFDVVDENGWRVCGAYRV
ncbi:hypothetical protein GCM10022251_04880 [Phytohabitans flavus]|uniref:DUF4878 domain-containing protein n=2 Tax=Phytohabitans flavus TaxID=1076124 RepID=A0A6F8Y302_9ACTN|nr:hypothetical protein [Phytohabitans flavus]BCB80351.1 hypothetical protein Pflav_067610 [Phytohabitans flavus]